MHKVILLVLISLAVTLTPTDTQAADCDTNPLIALYDFNESTGRYVTGDGPPMVISNTMGINWTDGGLILVQPVTIESNTSASDIVAGCMASNAITIELWLRNSNIDNTDGVNNILSLTSDDGSPSDFMIGQDGQGLTVNLRTTETDRLSIPAHVEPSVFTDQSLKHIVYTRNTIGDIRIYVNGVLVGTDFVNGKLTNWENQSLSIGPWLGEIRLVAIYNKPLTQLEVLLNYMDGESDMIPPVIPEYNPLVEARVVWSPPTYGTPVVKYIVQHSIDNGSWYDYAWTDSNTCKVNITFFNGHRVRVAGVDAENRQGPYSEPSNMYVPANSRPWPTGKPTKEQ